MRLKGYEIKFPEHFNKQAVVYKDNEPILGWLRPPVEFLSTEHAVLYNDFTNEIVEIKEDTDVILIENKYVVLEDIKGIHIVHYVLSEEGFAKFKNIFEKDYDFQIIKRNDFLYDVMRDQTTRVFIVQKVIEDIYMPKWMEILNKYNKHVEYPEDYFSRDNNIQAIQGSVFLYS